MNDFFIADIAHDDVISIFSTTEHLRPQPLVRCYARLIGIQVDIWPRPADIQSTLRSIVSCIEKSCQGILSWGFDGRKREINEKSLFDSPDPNSLYHEPTLASASQMCELNKIQLMLLKLLGCFCLTTIPFVFNIYNIESKYKQILYNIMIILHTMYNK